MLELPPWYYLLFEEQLRIESDTLDKDLWRGVEEFAEAVTYLPELSTYNMGPDGCLELIQAEKSRVHIPVIASLNGCTPGGWLTYAKDMEQAGADALELNLYTIEADPSRIGQDVEDTYCDVVGQVKANVRIPVADPADDGKHESGIGGTSGCVRTWELYPSSEFVLVDAPLIVGLTR
jgi:dihydroorotate dehydrogenase (fumarate)